MWPTPVTFSRVKTCRSLGRPFCFRSVRTRTVTERKCANPRHDGSTLAVPPADYAGLIKLEEHRQCTSVSPSAGHRVRGRNRDRPPKPSPPSSLSAEAQRWAHSPRKRERAASPEQRDVPSPPDSRRSLQNTLSYFRERHPGT